MKNILDSYFVWWYIGIVFPLATYIQLIRSLSSIYPNPSFDTFGIVLWCIIGSSLLIVTIKHFVFDDLNN
jgi:hypothetical protein